MEQNDVQCVQLMLISSPLTHTAVVCLSCMYEVLPVVLHVASVFDNMTNKPVTQQSLLLIMTLHIVKVHIRCRS